jgi:hypothetical protein
MILGVLEPEKEYSLEELEGITHKGPGGTFASHYLMWLSKRGFDVVRVSGFNWEAFRDRGIDYFAELGKDQLAYNLRSNLDYERSVIDDFLASVPTIRRRPTIMNLPRAHARGIIRVQNNRRLFCPASSLPWFSMYFRMTCSFMPTVLAK